MMLENLHATPYQELNQVLSHLINCAKVILKNNFVGAYLQGSFAIGDFSEFSDCDFMIVVDEDLSTNEVAEIQQLHKEIQQLPFRYWHMNIEGSYAPKDILRRWSLDPRDPPGEHRDSSWGDPGLDGAPPRCYPFWYLDHGSDTLVRSEHDNSQVVRWTLHEKGVHLSGPNITDLVDKVSSDELRMDVREAMDNSIAKGLKMPMFAWQAFWVGLFCRVLHTIETGTVTSKKEAMSWAQEKLHGEWQPLISQALSLRKGDYEQATSPVSREDIEATRKFAKYCQKEANHMLRVYGQ